MNSKMIVGLIVLGVAHVLVRRSGVGGSTANAAAKDLTEKSLNIWREENIKLGPLVVVSRVKAWAEGQDPTDLAKRRFSESRHREYVAWAKLGVIALAVDPGEV